ncbi:hypothetical protein [Ulvibacterium sp.]|uniref:hypothetical protein n=1 Tax=Ulvibacterium sp. TaxID=2665914 RepID=UPI003BABD82B
MFPFKKLDLLLIPMFFLAMGHTSIAKIPTTQNLGSPIYRNQTVRNQISTVTWNPGDSVTELKNVTVAISPRPVPAFRKLFAVSPQVTQIRINSAIHIISVEFPAPLATSIADDLLICGVVRGPGTNSFVDTSTVTSKALERVSQKNCRNYTA